MKKIIFTLSFLFLILGSISAPDVYSQQQGKVAGYVKDKLTGEPLFGAIIVLENKNTGAAAELDGYYVLLNVHPGTYTVVASMLGYRHTKIQDVKVSSGKTTTIDIEMESSAIVQDEVIVTANREIIKKDLTSSELSVSAEEIKKLPVENLGDILKLKAGVVTDAGGGIHIRGGRTSEVGYLIDGISVTDNYTGDRSTDVDVQFMEEVKVISGVFNAEYGQAMSGIVDIITKQGSDKLTGNINVSTGDYISSNKSIFINIDEIKPAAINDVKGNISGPINLFGGKLNYNLSFRRYYNEGYLFGQRRFNPKDSSYQAGDTYSIVATGDKEIVSLNTSTLYNFQGKINFDPSSSIKLSNLFLFDKSDNQWYNHEFKYNPDGLTKHFKNSFNNIFSLTYVLSDRAFLTLKHSFGFTKNRSYVFENIDDPRYANPELLRKLTAYSFLTGGTERTNDTRETTSNIIKGDFLAQIGKFNEFKSGFELRLDKIFLNNQDALFNGKPSSIFDFNRFLNGGEFEYTPMTIAFYIQDKIEYESIIINAGVRFDYFDSKGKIPTDYRDPENSEKVDSDIQTQLSPRIGVAFPISADGSIHFSYGHFFRIPDYEYLYTNRNFRVGPGGLYTLMGNANLNAESTTAYELGLHYKFFETVGLEVIGYFKDVSNLLGTEIYNTYVAGDRFALYTNLDYGKTKGITISLFKRPTLDNHLSVSLDYTLQVSEGNASDPNDAFNKAQGNPPQKTNIQVIPLNWDQRHTINLSVFYTIPDNLDFGIIGKFESGFPYTTWNQSSQISFENNARMPNKVYVDLQFTKELFIADQQFSIFCRVYNLLDTKNEIGVYSDTGRAGYSLISRYTPEYQGPNSLTEYLTNPSMYSEPRRIVLGINYNFNF
ncbi:MAG: TonB-dependent receptor [bacterium]